MIRSEQEYYEDINAQSGEEYIHPVFAQKVEGLAFVVLVYTCLSVLMSVMSACMFMVTMRLCMSAVVMT